MNNEMTSFFDANRQPTFLARFGLGVLLLMLASCQIVDEIRGSQSTTVIEAVEESSKTKLCEEPRPKICTMRYEPVCAVMATGRITTYPSACNACADVAVSGWRPEPCEEL